MEPEREPAPPLANPLRVVMLGPFGLHPKGTMRARALPAARALAARGHTVHVLMPPWHTPAEGGRAWQDAGVGVEYVGLFGLGLPGAGHGIVAARMARRALALAPDVVHAFKPKAYSGLAATMLRARQRLGAHWALVMDTDDWEGPGGWNDLEAYSWAQRTVFARQERWGLSHADGVTVASRALQTLTWSLGVPADRVTYLPNAVEADRLSAAAAVLAAPPALAADDAPRILLYTRFHEFVLNRPLAVLAEVGRVLPAARLVVAGRGLAGEERAFLDRAAELGLAEAVEYVGWLEPSGEAGLFASVDVALVLADDTLVNRTRSSMKLLDLLAAGLPVVAESVGQAPEVIVDGVSGLLAPAGDVAALATAVTSLLANSQHRARLGAAAVEGVCRAHVWSRRVVDLESAYAAARSLVGRA